MPLRLLQYSIRLKNLSVCTFRCGQYQNTDRSYHWSLTKVIQHEMRLDWQRLLRKSESEHVLKTAAIIEMATKRWLRWWQRRCTGERGDGKGIIILNIGTCILDNPLHPRIHCKSHNVTKRGQS